MKAGGFSFAEPGARREGMSRKWIVLGCLLHNAALASGEQIQLRWLLVNLASRV